MAADLPERVAVLEATQERDEPRLDIALELAKAHELELHGERGVNATLSDLNGRLVWLNRALWAVAAGLIMASVSFAFGSIG